MERPPVGVMLEVPSLLFMLPELKQYIDFISVGTNDLTQYLLAVDRNNTHVAPLYDSLHPAVLRMLNFVRTETTRLGIPVSVCGEMAANPLGAMILIGLGYRQLSMNGRSIPRIKYLLRHLDAGVLEPLLASLLDAQTAAEIREKAELFIENKGLGQLIRGSA